MKRRFITILSAICLVLSMSLVAACSGCSKKPPKAGDGVVYQTGAQSFWVGVGQAYMTFENVAEPEQKEENALYGNVFYVRVSSDSGKTYSPWLSGKWEMSEEKTELTLRGKAAIIPRVLLTRRAEKRKSIPRTAESLQ